MNDQDLRDCYAMFAMCGLLMRGDNGTAVHERAYDMADRMLDVRKWEIEPKEVGIRAVKRTRKSNDEKN